MTDQLAPLRITATLAAWCGLAALVLAGLLSPAAAFAAAVLVAGVSLSCSMLRSPAAAQLRKQLSFGTLVAALLFVGFHLRGSRDASSLAHTLPPLLIGVLTAQGLGSDKRHDVMVSLALGEFMIVLAVGVSPATAPVAIPMVLGWVLAIVALVQSHHFHSADCSAPALESSSTERPPMLGPAATAAALAVAIGMLIFLLVPHPSGTSAQRRLRNRSGVAGPGNTDPGSGARGRSAGHYSRENLDMRVRGKLGSTPVAEVPADSPQLWRSRIYDVYDGVHWTAEEVRFATLGPGRVRLPADPWDGGVAPTGPVRTDAVRTLAGFDGLILAPGTPVEITSGGRATTLGAAQVFIDTRGGYVVTSVLPQTNPATLASAPIGSTPDSTDDFGSFGHPQQLPPGLPDRVGALAREITRGESSRPAIVQAISTYLGAHKTYDVNSPVPASGADSVDDFLFNSQTGFCEQFAAAEVVLLRTIGIPARMATGYGYGANQANHRRLFTTGNLHAWVEVWYPGIGWSPTDPTPPAVQAAAGPHVSAFTRFVRWVQKLLAKRRNQFVLAAVIALVLAAGFGIAWLRRRRRTPAPATASPAALASSLLTAFARLESALAADSRPRAPAETLAELERRLGADAAGRRALATLELACYSPQQVKPEEARAAAQAFEQLAGSILAAHAARGQLADSIGVRR
ncbi:MAG: transglutaminaseTgpA domain-containing protein [Actinomycetota bacterium]